MMAGSGSWQRQIVFLLVLALPIASIAWTVTHEEVFREPREWCIAKRTAVVIPTRSGDGSTGAVRHNLLLCHPK